MGFAVIPNEAELNLAGKATGGWPATVHLYKNDLTPDPATVLTDFTEADFTGYATYAWPLSGITTDGGGKAAVNPITPSFSGPTDSVPQDVYGYYVTYDDGGDRLVMCGRFAGAPKTLSDALDIIAFDLAFRLFDAHQP